MFHNLTTTQLILTKNKWHLRSFTSNICTLYALFLRKIRHGVNFLIQEMLRYIGLKFIGMYSLSLFKHSI